MSGGDGAQAAHRVFVCRNPDCGLRFPVHANDRFAGRCPRCGAAVRCVASTQAEQGEGAGQGLPPASVGLPCPLHLLLDNWRSLFNVGSAFRTADGAGVMRLHLCGITATPENPRLAKTALQAEQSVAWDYAPDAVALAAALRAAGATLWALEMTGDAVSLFDAALPSQPEPVVLMLGNEVNGLDPGLLALADLVFFLPMHGHKRSLNVAIAASIATYWLVGRAAAGTASRHSVAG